MLLSEQLFDFFYFLIQIIFLRLNITEEMLVEALNYLQLNATLAPFTTAPTQKRVN